MRNRVYFARGQVPDGYFGDWATVEFYLDIPTGKTIARHKTGEYTYQTPLADTLDEAMWLLKNHPSSNARFITR